MVFHTFGDPSQKTMMLIHGVLTPWQIWEKQIEHFKEKYYVVVPALDAHVEECASEYRSVDMEAEIIEKYIAENLDHRVFALCGLSMGGFIANRIFERNFVKVDFLILDGAPLVKIPSLFTGVMTKQYKTIVHKSKTRDKKVLDNFRKFFLPERFLESYLKFVDTMSDSSIENMVNSVCLGNLRPKKGGNTRILFLHGTKGNEIYSKKAANKMKAYYPDLSIRCFKGYKHGELAIYKPDEWIEEVEAFICDR